MSSQIFDKARLRQLKDHAAPKIEDYNFLIKNTAKSIIDRLSVITLDFDTIAIYGARLDAEDIENIIKATKAKQICLLDLSDKLLHRNWPDHVHLIQSDAEWLPFGNQSLDALICTFEHHNLNDLPGALIQARRALKPDGLFISAMPGGDTLYELREAMTKAELELYGGLSPHIFPFADKQQYGGLMQRAGFALPVVDSEYITVSYTSIYKLFQDLKGMGEGNSLNARIGKSLNRQFFDRCEAIYRADNNFPANDRFDVTFEIIHMIGWSPDQSKQQQPLKPGSAEYKLSDILSSE